MRTVASYRARSNKTGKRLVGGNACVKTTETVHAIVNVGSVPKMTLQQLRLPIQFFVSCLGGARAHLRPLKRTFAAAFILASTRTQQANTCT
eukprot:1175686-Pleurochrysis_carterae.AAC.1